ncbi:hypothetical protein OG984_03045 [Nocardioides sp. NBC_00368]|uniref:hypothetical protein n=1 Tax=Nocardioides sp. NBC_00368 TaxID=2976000 RepID=UPI002E1F7DCD
MTKRLIQNGCALLDQDVRTAIELSWAVRTRDSSLWTSDTYSPVDPAELEEFDPAAVLLVVEKNITALDGQSGIEILLSAADALATEVMDRLNRPWPEVPGVGVLEISLVADDLVWASRGRAVCRFGGLRTLAAAP